MYARAISESMPVLMGDAVGVQSASAFWLATNVLAEISGKRPAKVVSVDVVSNHPLVFFRLLIESLYLLLVFLLRCFDRLGLRGAFCEG